jgi:acetate---CoA ligase (ADP-forming)
MATISPDFFSGVKNVAVIGASERNFYAAMAVRNLGFYGFEGGVYPVHRDGGELLGQPVVPSLAELPVPPDLAVVGVAADRAVPVIEELAGLGCRKMVLLADGYAERADEVGAARTTALQEACTRLDVELVGPNGIGVADFTSRVVMMCEPIPLDVRPGGVSLVSHSGALVSGILDGMVTEGVGVNCVVSVGNGSVLSWLDWLEFMVEDESTTTVACYGESVSDLGRFARIATRARALGKLVVLLKVGRSALGQDIALSHTASVAGEAGLLAAVAADHGVVLVPDIDSLVTVCHLASRRLVDPARPDSGPMVLTSSGGAAALSADLAAEAGVRLPELSPAAQELLSGLVSASGFVGNPVDLTASSGLDGPARQRLYATLLREESVTALLYVFGVNFPDDSEFRSMHRQAFAALVGAADEVAGKHAVVASVADQKVTGWVAELMDRSARAGMVGSLRRFMEGVAALQRRERWLHPSAHAGAALDLAASAAPRSVQGWVSEPEAKELLRADGFPVVAGQWVRDRSGLEGLRVSWSGPSVVKGVVRDVSHKGRLGLVKVGAVGEDGVREAARAIDAAVDRHGLGDRFDGYLVERMSRGLEFMVSTQRIGGLTYLTFALGGALVEAFATSATVTCPLHAGSWSSLLERSGLAAAVGALPEDVQAGLRDLVEQLGRSAGGGALSSFTTVELNPVMVDTEGEISIVDALVL